MMITQYLNKQESQLREDKKVKEENKKALKRKISKSLNTVKIIVKSKNYKNNKETRKFHK